MSDRRLVVNGPDGSHELVPGESLSFGRSVACRVQLDADDVGISRLAGSVDFVDGAWFVTNRSTTRPLSLVDPVGFRSVLAPGRRAVVVERLSVVVEGQVRRHELRLEAEGAPPVPAVADDELDGIATEHGGTVKYNDEDRRALVALFAGYLRPFPRHDPRPRSYAEAAADLGWPRTTVVKRIEYLRARLTRAGVPGLFGDAAMEALAEHVLTTGVVTADDLTLLDS